MGNRRTERRFRNVVAVLALGGEGGAHAVLEAHHAGHAFSRRLARSRRSPLEDSIGGASVSSAEGLSYGGPSVLSPSAR